MSDAGNVAGSSGRILWSATRIQGRKMTSPGEAGIGETPPPSPLPSSTVSAKGKQKETPHPAPPTATPPVQPLTFETSGSGSILLRSRPRIELDELGDPSHLNVAVTLMHPASDLTFLHLPAYDYMEQIGFGLHHQTALTACTIVAKNLSGYLSSYRERDATRRVPLSQKLLAPNAYYYHLDENPGAGGFYDICLDFRHWEYPHRLPPSWSDLPQPDPLVDEEISWSARSIQVKERDASCLVTGSREGLNTAHVVPGAEETWLERNKMSRYLGYTMPLNTVPSNLFSLRADLHQGFEVGKFAILPKDGRLVVHYLQFSPEGAGLYHNNTFDHNDRVSPDALFSRFAFALFKKIEASGFKADRFKPPRTKKDDEGPTSEPSGEEKGGDAGGRDTTRKHKRKADDSGDGGGSKPKRGRAGPSGAKDCAFGDKNSAVPNDWLSDVVLKMAPGESQSSLKADFDDIEEDLKEAAGFHPFFIDPSIKPTPHEYNKLLWYPGLDVVERRKKAYLATHPNIRAHGGTLMQDGQEMDNNE